MLQQATFQQANGHVAHLSLILSATQSPLLQRHCPRCKVDRDFVSSGKFRVNAQKKLIDVWLIFRCTVCDQTWNHAIHERQSVRALPPADLDAFMHNDPDLAAQHAALLLGRLGAAAPAGEMRVERRILGTLPAATERLGIMLVAPSGNALRLDRVLSTGLALPRSEVAALAESGALRILGAGEKAMRRPAQNGQFVTVDRWSYCGIAIPEASGEKS